MTGWDEDEIDDEFDEDADTVPCPECRAPVYDDADQCPQCGEWIMPLAASARPSRLVLIVCVLMVVLMLALVLW